MNKPLLWKHLPAGQNGFFRAPVLVYGDTEAVLIGGGFTFSDGRTVVEAIQATGKTLTTIYISQSDPDFYFSIKPIKDAFPNVRVLTPRTPLPASRAILRKNLPCGARN